MTKKVSAKVVLKEYEDKQGVRGALVILKDKQNIPVIFRITFELENGEEITLVVHQKIYDDLKVGDKGTLEYERKKFESFIVTSV